MSILQSPRFSLIVANYNNANYLKDCINSVIRQGFCDWEMIIYDDGSTDNSVEIINSYNNEKRIRLIVGEKNRGYIYALKVMIEESRSNIIGILDSDDALKEDALKIMYNAHCENLDYGLIYSQFIYCDNNLIPQKIGRCRPIPANSSELLENFISAFKTFKKHFYYKCGGFDENILYAEDRDFYYKMEEVTKVLFINKPLYLYRYVPTSQSHDKEKKFIGNNSTLIAKHNAYKRRLNTEFPNYSKREMSFLLIDYILLNIKEGNIKYSIIFLKRFFEPRTFRIKSLAILFLKLFKLNKIIKNVS